MSGEGAGTGMIDVEGGVSIPEEFDHKEALRQKILHALEVFPYISASMLHMAIGTATMTALWRPILDELVDEERISVLAVAARGPGRAQTHTIYCLPQRAATYPVSMSGSITGVTPLKDA